MVLLTLAMGYQLYSSLFFYTKFNIKPKISDCRKRVLEDHAFLINSNPGGLSSRLDPIEVDEETTFRDLRLRLELTQDGNDRGMMRRTTLFEELHFAMVHSPNPHNYIGGKRYKYRFGVFSKECGFSCGRDVPTLVPTEEEQSDKAVVDYLNGRRDLILIPVTQISPEGLCSPAVLAQPSP